MASHIKKNSVLKKYRDLLTLTSMAVAVDRVESVILALRRMMGSLVSVDLLFQLTYSYRSLVYRGRYTQSQ